MVPPAVDVHLKGNGEQLAVVLLAAGFGTRIKKDLYADSQFVHLANTPKPLLPLAGKPLISHWLPNLADISGVCNVTLVTNAAHYKLYRSWADDTLEHQSKLGLPPITVLCDSTTDNDSRFGAVHDLHIALAYIHRNSPECTAALVIAGDTLLPNVDVAGHIRSINAVDSPIAVFAYKLSNMEESIHRGMLVVDRNAPDKLVATGLVEKPATPDLAPSPWATAPVYFFHRRVWNHVPIFLSERSSSSLSTRDAPGLLLAWLIPQFRCHLICVPTRIDIGQLQNYKDAIVQYTAPPFQPPPRSLYEPAIGRAYPRIGFLGNPSDIYSGYVVAISIASEGFAEVVASPNDFFSIVWNEKHELPSTYNHLAEFAETVEKLGLHYGARNLIFAATLTFIRKWSARTKKSTDIPIDVKDLPNCRLSYASSIPQRVGLSGSSALILATWRALARFFNSSLEQIDPDRSAWVTSLRDVESKELGITCGLMDRVVQVMHGCVSMDFSTGEPGVWSWLPECGLPDMYILYYNNQIGECSGSIHGRAKNRIDVNDSRTKKIVAELASGAARGAELITAKSKGVSFDSSELCFLLDRNFDLRCELYGREFVGEANIRLVNTARGHGFAAKLAGSGGSVVCVWRGMAPLTDDVVTKIVAACKKSGMTFRRVKVFESSEK